MSRAGIVQTAVICYLVFCVVMFPAFFLSEFMFNKNVNGWRFTWPWITKAFVSLVWWPLICPVWCVGSVLRLYAYLRWRKRMRPHRGQLVRVWDVRNERCPHAYQLGCLEDGYEDLLEQDGPEDSEEWLEAVEKGGVRSTVLEGTISRVYLSGHADCPDFELTTQSGKSSWPRLGEDWSYVVGRRARVVCVAVSTKKPIIEEPGKRLARIVEIHVEVP